MELCSHGDLFSMLNDTKRELSWLYRFRILIDVAKALQFLHSQFPPIAHLDVKTPNVLISSLDPGAYAVAKLSDFGTSEQFENVINVRKVDNPSWLAPEILNSQPYTKAVDIYAFGIICWEVLTRKKPWHDIQWIALIQENIVSGERPKIPSYCSRKLTKLIQSCWHHEPSSRPGWDWILNSLHKISNNETSFYEKVEKQGTPRDIETEHNDPDDSPILDKETQKLISELTDLLELPDLLSDYMKSIEGTPNTTSFQIFSLIVRYQKENSTEAFNQLLEFTTSFPELNQLTPEDHTTNQKFIPSLLYSIAIQLSQSFTKWRKSPLPKLTKTVDEPIDIYSLDSVLTDKNLYKKFLKYLEDRNIQVFLQLFKDIQEYKTLKNQAKLTEKSKVILSTIISNPRYLNEVIIKQLKENLSTNKSTVQVDTFDDIYNDLKKTLNVHLKNMQTNKNISRKKSKGFKLIKVKSDDHLPKDKKTQPSKKKDKPS